MDISILTKLGQVEFSLVLDFLDACNLFHLYTTGNKALISTLHKCVTRFDLSYHANFLKSPHPFFSRFLSLKHLKLSPSIDKGLTRSAILDLSLSQLPKSLSTLILDIPNALAPLLQISDNTASPQSSQSYEWVDINTLFPCLGTLFLRTEAMAKNRSIILEPSKLPRSLTRLTLKLNSPSIQKSHFNVNQLGQLPNSLTQLKAIIAGSVDSSISSDYLLPSSLTKLHVLVSDESFLRLLPLSLLSLYIVFEKEITNVLGTHSFPPQLTNLQVNNMPLTVRVAKYMIPPTVLHLCWNCYDGSEVTEATRFLPPNLTYVELPWRLIKDPLPSLPPTVTHAAHFQPSIQLLEGNLASLPPWAVTTVQFWEQSLDDESVDTRSDSPNGAAQSIVHSYSALLHKLSPYVQNLSFYSSIHPNFIHMPLPSLVSLDVLSLSLTTSSGWMKWVPKLEALNYCAKDLTELESAPFILKSLEVKINSIGALNFDVSKGESAFNWAITPSTAKLISLRVDLNFTSAESSSDESSENRRVIDASEYPSMIAQLFAHLPSNLANFTFKWMENTSHELEAVCPTSIFRSLPKTIRNLSIVPLALEPPFFCITDFQYLPRQIVYIYFAGANAYSKVDYPETKTEAPSVVPAPASPEEVASFAGVPYLKVPVHVLASVLPKLIGELTIPPFPSFYADRFTLLAVLPMLDGLGWALADSGGFSDTPQPKLPDTLLLSPLVEAE